MRNARLLAPLLAACAAALGCTSDQVAPEPIVVLPAPTDAPPQAIPLLIDGQTGAVRVGATPDGQSTLAYSMLGDEVIELFASNCTFSALPRKSRLKRCTMEIGLRNRLTLTDLLQPTDFPTPPDGLDGILVFPWIAAGLGVPGSGAVPTADWDHGPTNLFNDFSGCTTGAASDCYRYEVFPAPLYGAGQTAARTVGFDIDRDAQQVAVYVVVAADLRENPPVTASIPASLDGWIRIGASGPVVITNTTRPLSGQVFIEGIGLSTYRAFFRFGLSAVPAGAPIVRATLRLYQQDVGGDPFQGAAVAVADHVDLGASLDLADYDAAPLPGGEGFAVVSDHPGLGYRDVDVTDQVRQDLAGLRAHSAFRIRLDLPFGGTHFVGWTDSEGNGVDTPPELLIEYRNP